ncbi:transposase [Streptomyces viridosporus]
MRPPHHVIDVDVDFETAEENVVVGAQAEQVRQFVRAVVRGSETADVGSLAVGLDPLWRTSKIKGFGPGRMSTMESMGKKRPRPRRSFTPEFKAEIVGLCRRGDRSVGQVAKDFDPTGTAVRDRVRQAEVDAGERDGLTSSEREEPARLRRENRRLREDVEILKRATAFFATETR